VTDEMLMLEVREGRLDSLATLFERHHRPLFGFFAHMTGDRPAAEDLVQDVFVRVLKYRHAYRAQGSFRSWLFRIARNARHDFAAKNPILEPIPEDDNVPVTTPGPSAQLEQREEVELLRQALRQLSADKRELIILARYHDMTYDELGALLDADPGTIRVRLHRAVRQLDTIVHRLRGQRHAL
jgi:RNA polymerase sigma-70 factor (ECF subfamily)